MKRIHAERLALLPEEVTEAGTVDREGTRRAECMGTAPHSEHTFNGGMWCPGLDELLSGTRAQDRPGWDDTLAVLEGTTQQRRATARQLAAPPVTRTERTRVQYRIESKGPRARAWHYLAFTHSAGPDPEVLRYRIEQAKVESPGIKFRIVGRTVVTITETTRWEVVQ
jgi:hypothetical protein